MTGRAASGPPARPPAQQPGAPAGLPPGFHAASPAVTEPHRLAVLAFRLVALAWLVTAYVKVHLYLTILGEARAWPVVEHPLLPGVMTSPWAITVAYWAPLCVVPMLFLPKRRVLIAAAGLLLASSVVLGWSLDTHNDATWITGAWVAGWLLWLAVASTREDAGWRPQAVALAQLVVALCFLGGFTGKLTAGYWDGEVLDHLYWARKESWPWPWLREAVGPEGRAAFMLWFSRATVVMEGLLVLLPLAPARFGAPAAAIAMVGMVVVSTWTLTSVMACLVGLMIAAWWIDRVDRATLALFIRGSDKKAEAEPSRRQKEGVRGKKAARPLPASGRPKR